MCWRLILKEFGPNIQHIAGVDNIVDDTLSIFPPIIVNRDDPSITRDLSRTNR